MSALLIGLGHQRGVGKDAIADFLVKEHNFTKLAFADALKSACAAVYGFTQDQLYGQAKGEVDPYWGETPGKILQTVGTECFRRGHRDDVWVKALGRRVYQIHECDGVPVVVTDVRFQNECEAIKEWGGRLIKVIRPGPQSERRADSQHPSETALADFTGWDGQIINDSTLEVLYLKAENALGLEISDRASSMVGF